MAPAPIRRKLVIVGDGACGKTSLLCVFALGEFPFEYQPTIFENYVAEIRLDQKPVLLALWDTAGQEEYERLRPLSYSHAHVILIAFAVDTKDSLDNVRYKWNEEVRQICGKTIPVILVGCKADLREEAIAKAANRAASVTETADPNEWQQHFVTRQQGQEMAKSIGARAYLETSALKNEGVDAVFEAATRAAMLVRDGGSPAVGTSNGPIAITGALNSGGGSSSAGGAGTSGSSIASLLSGGANRKRAKEGISSNRIGGGRIADEKADAAKDDAPGCRCVVL